MILLMTTLCIICNIIVVIDVVDAFSTVAIPLQKRRCDGITRTNTQLYEQPIDIKNILGPISPSTLEKYNLPPETFTDQNVWSAQFVTRRAKVEPFNEITDVQLVPRNPVEHYVDTYKIEVPIPLDSPPGLGIELLELEGGGNRNDGLGIVIVNGLVGGGNAERATNIAKQKDGEWIMVGDSLIGAELILQRRGSQTDVTSIKTECLGYDSTVDALVGMLSPLSMNNDDDSIADATVMLTFKRLRRRPGIKVTLHYPPSQNLPPETIQLQPGDNLRMVMLQRGIKLNDPLAQRYDGKASNSGNCGGGSLCRTCAVSVMRGGELISRPKENERKMMDDMPRWRLVSCFLLFV